MALVCLQNLFNLRFFEALIIKFTKKIFNKLTSTRTHEVEEEDEEEQEQGISHLPIEVTFEILTRVSLQSLYTCRSVCKQWRQLTYDFHFIHQHCLRTQSISGFFIQSIVRNKYKASFVSIDQSPQAPQLSLDFLPENIHLEASSSHGLILCVSGTAQYYICKPATKQYRKLPKPRIRFFTKKTALIVQPQEPFNFKILRLSQCRRMPRYSDYDYLHCELFDSQRWAWKRLRDVRLPLRFLIELGSAVSVNGSCHWLIKHLDTREFRILAFEVERETWRTIQMPGELDLEEDYDGFNNSELLVDCKGQLSLVQVTKNWMRIWVLSDYSRERWRKKDKLSLEAINKEKPLHYAASLYTEEVVFMANSDKVSWYNCESNKLLTDVNINHGVSRDCYVFQSDMLPCKMVWK